MTADEPATEPVDDGYPGSARLAAGLAALFVPAISLVVALVLRSGERRPRRRSQPATWALAAGGVMPAQLLLAVILVSAASS